jgi:hypothetical protein
MSDYTLRQVGLTAEDAQNIVDDLRERLNGVMNPELAEEQL